MGVELGLCVKPLGLRVKPFVSSSHIRYEFGKDKHLVGVIVCFLLVFPILEIFSYLLLPIASLTIYHLTLLTENLVRKLQFGGPLFALEIISGGDL